LKLRCVTYPCFSAGLDSSQDVIIGLLEFDDCPQEELDAWFAAHSIRRAEIRARVRPYATPDWPTRFPRYADILRGELVVYEMVVGAALRRHGGTRRRLPGPAQVAAFTEAGEVFAARVAAGMLPAHLLPNFSCRLAIERAEASGPRIEYETYEPPPLDAPAYRARAPLPERGDIVLPPQVRMEDCKLLTFNVTLQEYIARTTQNRKRSPSPSSADLDAPHATRGCRRGRPRGNSGGHR
jgi:hypothetical protein